jgi:chromosome segregation ATPase
MGDADVRHARAKAEELRVKLERNKAALGAWCDARRATVADADRGASARLDEVRLRIEELRREQARLDSVGFANSVRLDAEAARVRELQGSLGELRAAEEDAENRMGLANAKLGKARETVASAEKGVASEAAQQEYQVNQLTRGAKLYKKLGLEFERVGGARLKLSFTKVDPKDPDRVFFIVIFVDQSDQYHVEQVEPSIGSVAGLLQQVNATNDFSLFVRTVRKQFQALCR